MRRYPLTRPDLVILLAAGLAVAVALWQLAATSSGVTTRELQLGATPVTLFEPAGTESAPTVVIAHGFAGSQQLMRSFALTLARNGYLAITFDFLGHGRNGAPLHGELTDPAGAASALVEELHKVVRFARNRPRSDGRMALLGHSMAGDIVVRYARQHPSVAATVAVSLFSPGITRASPRNLLVIVGNLEPAVLKDEARRIVAMAPGADPPQAFTTYGDFGEGTARRLVLSPGVEHIGVLYGRTSLAEALAWLNRAFDRRRSGDLAVLGPWIALLMVGVTLLARPLSAALPRAAVAPCGVGARWRHLLPLAAAPAVLTPLLARLLPSDFSTILIGDYLAIHFGLYGLLTAGGLWLLRRRTSSHGGPARPARLALATGAILLYGIAALGLPLDRFVTSLAPIPERLPVMLAILLGTLPFFLADEWLTRGASAARGAYLFTKVCLLASLGLAVALDPERLFFLLIIVPVVVLFFVIFGLVSRWAYRRCHHPLAAGMANAVILAWAIGTTFPLVAG